MDAITSADTLVHTAAVADQTNQEAAATDNACLCGMDLAVYNAAKEGNLDTLGQHRKRLDQILTPTKNTVLHIYITCAISRPLFNHEEKELNVPYYKKKFNEYFELVSCLLGFCGANYEAEDLKIKYCGANCEAEDLKIKYEEAALMSTKIVEEIVKMCPSPLSLLLHQNDSGDTALHVAARHGRADVVEVLIKAAKGHYHNGDLEEGISSEEALRMIRTTNKEKDTATHEAIRFNHLDVVKIFTREDPDFRYSANAAEETPLYLAVERGYRDLASELLRSCKNPSYEGPNGRTALHAAVIFDDEAMTRELLNHTQRALTKSVDIQGWTPLHFAALLGHDSIVKQLLEFDRCAAYMPDKYDKKTPLHIAYRYNERAHFLLSRLLLTGRPHT